MITTLLASIALLGPQDPMAQYKAKMVPIGKPLPDFSLQLARGGTLSLKQAIKGKKGTLVNFWFYG